MSEIGIGRLRRTARKRHQVADVALMRDSPRDPAARDGATSAALSTGARCGWGGAARWWFEALDDRRVDEGGAAWVAQVVGIHEVRPHLWIQIESADAVRRVVLHVTLETRLEDALAAMAASPCGNTGPQLVEARRLARA